MTRLPPRVLLPRLALALAGVTLALWLAGWAVDLSLHKTYSLDEFQYAHGSWLVARGQVPYRDFFEHHFPLVHQLLALPWLAMDDDPGNLLVLRVAMLPFLLAILLAGLVINRRVDARTGWVTPLVLLAIEPLVVMGTEIRPDPVALALFLAALAVVSSRRWGPWSRGLVGGLLLTAAVWGSQKVFYYGLVFPAAWVLDLMRVRQRRGRFLLGHPLAFALGSVCGLAGLGVYLGVTGSFWDAYEWGLRWSFVHQLHYPVYPWTYNFWAFLGFSSWLLPFAAVGVAGTLQRLRANGEDGDLDAGPDLLLLAALVTTLASFVWQAAPYLYSLLPFMALLGLFAARGLTGSVGWLLALRRRRPTAAGLALALLALLGAGELLHLNTELARARQSDNEAQHRELRTLAELTDPEDPVYDLAGRAVSRPSVHYFYFTDAVVRDLLAERLAREIPAALVETGCTVYFHARDRRLTSLPPSLQAFLRDHYQPFDDDLWLWGQRYETAGESFEGRFLAVRDAVYVVDPPSLLTQGRLWIGGVAIESPFVRLPKGEMGIRWEGPPVEFFLLWLPRDGRPWHPRPQEPEDGGAENEPPPGG